MTLTHPSLLKLKKNCQENLYNSINTELSITNSQTYMPVFSKYVNFKNEYSKKMFIFDNKYILLKVEKEISDNTNKNNNSNSIPTNNKNPDIQNLNVEYKERETMDFDINESQQGKIYGYVVNKNIYKKSKDYDDYKNYIAKIPMFIKSNPVLDVLNYMEGQYDYIDSIPSMNSYVTNNKINNINNNAYIEVICSYFLSLLNEEKYTSLFPNYYGSFNGKAKNYVHDITEDYPQIRSLDWFMAKNERLKYEILKDYNLDEFINLSFKNIKKIDYESEIKNQDNNKVIENESNIVNESNLEEIDIDIDIDNELENIYENKDRIEKDNKKKNLYKIIEKKLLRLNLNEEDDNDELDEEMEIGNSDSDWSDISDDSISSSGSCIFNEIYVKLRDFPIQILCMENLEITLTKLAREGISNEEWKTILFEIIFGLAVAQKRLYFVHNDLHSDNIMFKKIDKEYKYYKNDKKYFKVPTFFRETKIIDFARGIVKVNNNLFFSDVFKTDGDAGGQYNYLHKTKYNLKHKKLNFSFDLARLATTLTEYIDDIDEQKELYDFIIGMCVDKNGENLNDLEDDFGIYISICENACNAIPKKLIENDIFKRFLVNIEDIPEGEHIYQL